MKEHTRFVAVAGLLPSGDGVDANLRKLQVDFWVVCANVRACKIDRPSVLITVTRGMQVFRLTTDRAFRTSCFPASRGQLT